MASKKTFEGIDVSKFNGVIDFQKVKKAGKSFVIMRAGGSCEGFFKDTKFENNYRNAKAAGLNVGAYYIPGVNFKTAADGRADAYRFLKQIQGKSFEMPVYLDIECQRASNRKGNTDAAIEFCRILEKAGYFVGIYASDKSGFESKLQLDRLKDFSLWVANYGPDNGTEVNKPVKPSYVKSYAVHQYTQRGTCPGIYGKCDLDTMYEDLPKIIKSKHFNNC